MGHRKKLPIERNADIHRIALDTETPKREEALRHDKPDKTAPTTRSRRSAERGLPMDAGLHIPAPSFDHIYNLL
jgi:hypothetical protein